MRRERLLAAAAVAVLLATTLAAATVPGAISPPPDRREPPGFVDLRETTVATKSVSGATATLTLTSFLVHEGGVAENVTVVYRAQDLDTGFVSTVVRVPVGDVTRDGEHRVTGNVTVERQGGYRLLTLVYRNGTRIQSGRTEVRGLGTLKPAYAVTPIEFHQFERTDLPAVEYRIERVEANTTTMRIITYLTNQGSTASDDLRLVVKARQADSNIVADAATIRVGSIQPGRTATPTATLRVPSEYNYYLDAVLWKDGVIVGSTRAVANLDPRETISANVTTREVGLEVSDFEEAGDGAAEPDGAHPEPTTTAAASPGFTVLASILALVGSVFVARRWSA